MTLSRNGNAAIAAGNADTAAIALSNSPIATPTCDTEATDVLREQLQRQPFGTPRQASVRACRDYAVCDTSQTLIHARSNGVRVVVR